MAKKELVAQEAVQVGSSEVQQIVASDGDIPEAGPRVEPDGVGLVETGKQRIGPRRRGEPALYPRRRRMLLALVETRAPSAPEALEMRRARRRSHVHDVWCHPHVSSTPARGNKSY